MKEPTSILAALGLALAVAGGDGQERDREKILAHIHGIFRAYLEGNRDAIRNAHSEDWTGFLGPSTKIERGIEDYMGHADRSLSRFEGTGYEILDTEVQLYGDVAIVFYVAEYRARDRQSGKDVTIPLRSIDVYRREKAGWNQAGSHITPIPEKPSWLPSAE